MLKTNRLQGLNQLQQYLLGSGGHDEKLTKITEGVVQIFNADFCRIWIKGPGDLCEKGCIHATAKDPEKVCRLREYCLHLVAGSGRYTHIDGPHSRMPFGLYKVGRIAVGQINKFLTNNVVNDPQIMDHKWAKGLGLVSFAGYKLQDTDGEPIGVLALFSKQSITPEEDAMLEGLAGITTHVIQIVKAEGTLKVERDKLVNILESMGDGVYISNQTCDIEYINPVIESEFGPINGRKCYEYFHDRDEVCPWCKNQDVFAGKTVRWEWHSNKNNKTYDLLETPLRNRDGTISKLEIFRDITDRKYAEHRLAIQFSVVRVLAESATLKEATPKIIEAICESTGWDMGAIWNVDHEAGVLRCIEHWHMPSVDFSEFEMITRQYTFQRGIGMPGRVWDTGKPAWIIDVAQDTNFPRAPYAARSGLHSAFGFPIKFGSEVCCIMEFFSREIRQPDEGLLQMFNAIGSQIGQFMERKETETELKKNCNLLNAVIEGTTDAIFVKDLEGRYLMINPPGARLIGRSVEEVIGKDDTELFVPDAASQIMEDDRNIMRSGETKTCEEELLATAGIKHTYLTTKAPFLDHQGRVIGIIDIARDITERKQAEEQIHHLAYYDMMTNLPNRLSLHDDIDRAISQARTENSPFALLIINLDRFEEINNTLGHDNGDLILQQIAIRLQGICGEPDMVARLGGDIFAALLQRTDAEGAAMKAEEIIGAIKEFIAIADLSIEVSASAGISLFPGHGADADSLIRRAEIAMYAAKRIENSLCIYSPQYDQYSQKRLALMGELRQAIEQDQLFLLYQPKIELKTGRILGVEALCRWQHPKSGVIPPNDFIFLAERGGLIKELTLWVIKEAMRQSRIWHKGGLEVSLAINLSVRSLQNPELLDKIKGLISTWGIAPSSIRFEITESIIMQNPELAMEIITELSSMGIKFSIDDFGTGYSSLSYLQRLPVDEIKVDKSFVINMETDKNNAMIVRSVIELAHNLGLKVTAEGVESKEVMDRLVSLGCDQAQGYFISRPIPQEEIAEWLRK